MSSKNNVNADHYKTAGRGRPWEGAAAGLRKHTPAKARDGAARDGEGFPPGARVRRLAEMRPGKFRRRQRPRRLSKLKGLTARLLFERRMRLRQERQG